MSIINNDFCDNCVKVNVCEWNKKIEALRGTEKKPILLDLTINECGEYLSNGNEDPEENE